MAKSTALQLVNKIMDRIFQDQIVDVSADTGHGRVALSFVNDAVMEMYNKISGRWHSMLTFRKYMTPFDVIVTVKDYSQLSGETITITYFGSSVVLTEGVDFTASTDNDTTAASLQAALIADTTLSAGTTAILSANEVTFYSTLVNFTTGQNSITAVSTSVTDEDVLTATTRGAERMFTPANFGSMYLMKDLTNNRIIHSEYAKVLDFNDPDETEQGTPIIYSLRNDYLKMHPKPSSNIKIHEIYWKLPTTLAANSDEYDLPEFCDSAILKIAESEMYYYLDKTSKGDRARGRAKLLIEDAIETNDSILDRIMSLDASGSNNNGLPLTPPNFGSSYPTAFGN